MHEGLVDYRAIAQCLAAIISEPTLLDEYPFEKEDFYDNFHSLIFSAVSNLYMQGQNVIDIFGIDSYLSGYDAQYKIFTEANGLDYINDILTFYEKENFLYYFDHMKKYSLLRYWESKGLDIKPLYDYTVTDLKEQEKQKSKLDSMSVKEMIDKVSGDFVEEPVARFVSSSNHKGQLAGKGLKELKESFKKAPDYGLPLQSPMMSTVARGCRLGKLYLRSSNSGGGKTRTGLADMANISIPYKYNLKDKKWEYTGFSEPVLMISTELDFPEVQTILAAYVSGVNEDHIRENTYTPGEEERVDQAIQYIESSPFYIEFIPNFGVKDILQLIKKYKREQFVYHFFFDYIHMSNKLIVEMASMSSGMKLREDQILFLFVDSLKNLCNELGIFILSSTQLNGTYKDSAEKDETMLRGAKSMADRIDLGEISLDVSPAESKILEKITKKIFGCPEPNLIRHIYKLRANRWSKIKIVQHVNLATGRTQDLFALNKKNKLIDIPIVNIENIDAQKAKEIESLIEDNSEDVHNMPDDLEVSDLQTEDAIKKEEPEQLGQQYSFNF